MKANITTTRHHHLTVTGWAEGGLGTERCNVSGLGESWFQRTPLIMATVHTHVDLGLFRASGTLPIGVIITLK